MYDYLLFFKEIKCIKMMIFNINIIICEYEIEK